MWGEIFISLYPILRDRRMKSAGNLQGADGMLLPDDWVRISHAASPKRL